MLKLTPHNELIVRVHDCKHWWQCKYNHIECMDYL